jgi:hypothetical protein
MMPSFTSTALKILAGAGLFALSFWLTLQAMDYFQSPWEPIRSNAIATYGEASSSGRSFTDSVTFRFLGDGYAEVEDTNELQCLKFECRFSLVVAFAPTQAGQQLIIGQSFVAENGWHLLLVGGSLVLQREGGSIELAAPFTPKPGQRYKIDIARADRGVRISVDDVVLVSGDVVPFTDIARNLTIGGRAGPSQVPLTGAVSDVEVARLKPQQ